MPDTKWLPTSKN